MKTAVSALSLLVAIGSGPVMADCTSDQVHTSYVQLTTPQQVSALLVGNTACYPAGGPPWENQESLANGTITDYKQGSNAKDPTGSVGGYTVNPDGSIKYSYTSGPSFTYIVWGPTTSGTPGLYDFCNNLTQTFLPFQVSVIGGGPVPCRSAGVT